MMNGGVDTEAVEGTLAGGRNDCSTGIPKLMLCVLDSASVIQSRFCESSLLVPSLGTLIDE